MPTKISKYTFTKIHFIAGLWVIAGILFGLKCAFPRIAGKQLEEVKEYIEARISHEEMVDSIALNSQHVDSLICTARPKVRLTDRQGNPIKNSITQFHALELDSVFPDLNDVQLATAQHIGITECRDRREAANKMGQLVYIGDSPYYDMENLTYSVPYLVPRAALLLDEISRNYMDSLASKGIPFHKFIVTSVLRTTNDVRNLRRHNGNASENSCHRFGTTFDIAYTTYHRVQDPDQPPQPETWASTLKFVLAEVLSDLRQQGACYVKYEHHQSCFHITCR